MAKEGSTVSGLMDSFATAVSLALQHGVPLRVLCEKFAHTRFEPSGWTGNEQIGYAKSIMDYIFRWIQIRFLSGHQFNLFAGLAPTPATIPVEGTVTAPGNASSALLTGSSPTLPGLSLSDAELSSPLLSSPASFLSSRSAAEGLLLPLDAPEHHHHTTPPQQGIAPDLAASSGLNFHPHPKPAEGSASLPADRGIYHTANAIKSIVDMGDAPSCATCGAIMTRNGSCYRCNECGSTSGCS